MPGLSALSLLALAAWAAPAPCPGVSAWTPVIEDHLLRYPSMEVDDLYKLLHQGVRGSEHAVESEEGARLWLERELTQMGQAGPEALVDTIAPGGLFVRVHLRPFVSSGGDPAALTAAFVATANGPAGATGDLACVLDAVVALAGEGRLPWNPEELTRRFEALAAEGYPAVHHSEAFERRYHPAYRVVAGTLLEAALRRAGGGEGGPISGRPAAPPW